MGRREEKELAPQSQGRQESPERYAMMYAFPWEWTVFHDPAIPALDYSVILSRSTWFLPILQHLHRARHRSPSQGRGVGSPCCGTSDGIRPGWELR